tara:strand:+ start:276 stop:1451 length:1176 start_codon:yes stop_codon:yes gene_type:complete
MSIEPASRLTLLQPPATLVAGEKARQQAGLGKDIIDLGQSSPHHITPDHIIKAGVSALESGLTNISSSSGIPEFKQALAKKLQTYNNLNIDADKDVIVTPGSKMGLYESINAFVGPGDDVLIIEPTWVSFKQQVALAQGNAITVPLSEEEEYMITYDQLNNSITDQCKMIVINNPNNPTGRVYTKGELEDVARVCQENDLLALCDETYEYFTYDNNSHITLASLPGMWNRTLTSYTFTKAYAMAGWRLACIVGPSELISPLISMHEHTAGFVSPFIQVAGAQALQGPQDHISIWKDECDMLRTEVARLLNSVPGVTCPLPQGATFVFPRYDSPMSSTALSELLVEEEDVVVTPGVGFGLSGENHFRIALMRSPVERVLEGAQRIVRFLERL